MRSVEARFRKMTLKHPSSSSFICFGRAVRGQKFGKSVVAKFFGRLVDKGDYARSDKRRLVKHCCVLTEKVSPIVDAKKRGKNARK